MLASVHTVLKLALIWAILSASLIGCMDSTHDFKIRFSDVHGLHKGNSVYFENTVIGNIEELRKRLKGTGQEEDLGPIDQKMGAIHQELSV